MSKAAQNKPTENRIGRYAQRTLAPYEVSQALKPTIERLNLWKNVNELRDHGFTVVEDVCDPELMDELREVIHTFAGQTDGPGKGYAAAMLLGRHAVVDRIATLPKILALAEVSVGKGMRAGQFIGTIKTQGTPALGLHADQNWMPAPFPEHNLLLTYCIPCEGMTAEGGATTVVPGSQSLRRHPTNEELEDPITIPIEVEKGSVAVWDGSVWHASGARTIAGTRTVLHATYQRLYTQPIDNYDYLLKDNAYVNNASPELLSLLGTDLFYGTATPSSGGTDMEKFMKSASMSKE
jgi:ectoine hydroxylase-related dioxygenase (phytanoyl-CoA dioxygenase family)